MKQTMWLPLGETLGETPTAHYFINPYITMTMTRQLGRHFPMLWPVIYAYHAYCPRVEKFPQARTNITEYQYIPMLAIFE